MRESEIFPNHRWMPTLSNMAALAPVGLGFVVTFVFAVTIMAVLTLAAPATAQPHPANPARPTFLSPATGLAVGSVQIETGYLFSRGADDASVHLSPFAVRLQVLDWLEPRIFWDGVGQRRGADIANSVGVGDLGLGAAFYFREDSRWVPALGALLTVTLPVATQGLGQDVTRIEARILVDKAITSHFTFSLNAGLAGHFPKGQGDSDLRMPLTAMLTAHVFGLADIYGEVFGELDLREPRAAANFAARAGVGVRVLDELVFDVSVDFGVTEPAPSIGAQAGLTWNIGRLF